MNCPKHVEFYSKNKFEKLVHLVGFIIRIYHDERSRERQIVILSKCYGAKVTQVTIFVPLYSYNNITLKMDEIMAETCRRDIFE